MAAASAIPTMAGFEEGQASSSKPQKEMIVRVRRKRCDSPVDALLLEFNDRPKKRQNVDGLLKNLSLDDATEQGKNKKLLFHHIETLSTRDNEGDLLTSILKKEKEDGALNHQVKQQREDIKKSKDKKGELRTSAWKQHETTSKSARFQLVWKSRKEGAKNACDEAFSELCQLYDVIRVNSEPEANSRSSKQDKAKREPIMDDSQLLCNFIPLLREFIPDVAEFESEVRKMQHSEDDYVYDVYTLKKDASIDENDITNYPRVQVDDDELFCDGATDSDADSEDSNAENNPLNDYPDESEDGEDDEDDSSNETEEKDSDEDDCEVFEEENSDDNDTRDYRRKSSHNEEDEYFY